MSVDQRNCFSSAAPKAEANYVVTMSNIGTEIQDEKVVTGRKITSSNCGN